MARRKQFNGIVNDLTSKIHSRNFDIDGYWGVAFLCVTAKSHRTPSVRILCNEDTDTTTPFALPLKKNLLKFVHRQMRANKMPIAWLKQIEVLFEFNAAFDPKLNHPFDTLAPPFRATVVLTSDLDRTFTKTTAGYCWERLYFSCRRQKSCRDKWF
ncbi:hypothetical protein [Roseovarius sp. 2305UL8-3]|uniref:hypothetical protein n=1 Tax=Roseovarius conchicola TaxID=3121636 RepID=UPI00352719B5